MRRACHPGLTVCTCDATNCTYGVSNGRRDMRSFRRHPAELRVDPDRSAG